MINQIHKVKIINFLNFNLENGHFNRVKRVMSVLLAKMEDGG